MSVQPGQKTKSPNNLDQEVRKSAAPAVAAGDHERRGLSDEQYAECMAEVARRRQSFGQPVEQVAAAMKIGGPAVSRYRAAALQTGVLAFSIDARFGLLGKLDEGKARELKDAFRLRRQGLVVELDPDDLARKDELTADDYSHTVLANRTGEQVVELLDSDDHLALGPGRPVNHVAHYIARKSTRQQEWERIRVTPLAGRLGARSWATSGPRYARAMDSDDATYIVALALENLKDTEFSWIGHSLFAADAQEAARIMRESCRFQPDGTWLDGKIPTKGIVGVGAVTWGHRLAGLRQPEPDPSLEEFLGEDVAGDLSALIANAGQVDGCVLSDVVNRYFVSLPAPRRLQEMTEKEFTAARGAYEEDLAPAVESLNERVVAARWSHLRQIPKLVAVAGGRHKLEALWTLLLAGQRDRDRHVIKALNTDWATADALCAARLAWDKCNAGRRDWCIRMAERIFQ